METKRPKPEDYEHRNIMYPSNYIEGLNKHIDHIEKELQKEREKARKVKNLCIEYTCVDMLDQQLKNQILSILTLNK